MAKFLPLILCTLLLNALSQILMKHGMAIVGKFEYSASHLLVLLSRAATNPLIIIGLATMTISMCTHLLALSRFDVSFAFPFLSIAYIIVAVYGALVLGENVSVSRAIGICLVCFGTVLIARS